MLGLGLLWRSQTSRVRASSASTPRLPDADPRDSSAGQTRDLPVPAQRASTHARVLDHAGSGGGSRYRLRPCCLPYFRTRRHPGCSSFRGSMAGLCAPLPTLRRHPRGCQRTAQGRCGSLLLHRGGLSPPTPCRSSRRTESLEFRYTTRRMSDDCGKRHLPGLAYFLSTSLRRGGAEGYLSIAWVIRTL